MWFAWAKPSTLSNRRQIHEWEREALAELRERVGESAGLDATWQPFNVVDDDFSVRESLESLIRSVGMSVTVFSSAEDLLNAPNPCEAN